MSQQKQQAKQESPQEKDARLAQAEQQGQAEADRVDEEAMGILQEEIAQLTAEYTRIQEEQAGRQRTIQLRMWAVKKIQEGAPPPANGSQG